MKLQFPLAHASVTGSFVLLLLPACTRQNAVLSGDASTQSAPLTSTVRASAIAASASSPAGFASLSALGQTGTTGGGAAPAITVRTAREFQSAVERLDIKDKSARDASPRVILVGADLDLGELANETGGKVLKSVGKVRVRSHTSILGAGAGKVLRSGILDVKGAQNVIVRNLRFRDLWEEDPSGNYDDLGWDFVRITNSGTTKSHHIWIDHCDFGKVYDGMIDITHGSDLVTISWCRFAGDEHGAQKKAMLIGHSSSDSAAATDKGRLNVSLHHCWFENIDDRAPRARFGNIHVWNNCVDGAKNATMSVAGAVTLVENSIYRNAQIATSFSHDKDAVSRGRGGTICIVDSRNIAPRALKTSDDADRQFEIKHNFQSSIAREKLQFNAPADWKWPNRNQLPYSYAPDAPEKLVALVQKGAGTGQLAELTTRLTARQSGK